MNNSRDEGKRFVIIKDFAFKFLSDFFSKIRRNSGAAIKYKRTALSGEKYPQRALHSETRMWIGRRRKTP